MSNETVDQRIMDGQSVDLSDRPSHDELDAHNARTTALEIRWAGHLRGVSPLAPGAAAAVFTEHNQIAMFQ